MEIDTLMYSVGICVLAFLAGRASGLVRVVWRNPSQVVKVKKPKQRGRPKTKKTPSTLRKRGRPPLVKPGAGVSTVDTISDAPPVLTK